MRLGALALLLLALAGCDSGGGEPAPAPEQPEAERHPLPHHGPYSADAQLEVTESLLQDLEAPRHPSDGGGRAWIEEAFEMHPDGPREAPVSPAGLPVFAAGSPARLRILYEAGPEGIAVGGVLFLQVSPFWDWDDPQPDEPEAPGFTEVRTDAEGVTLERSLVAQQLLAVEIGGRPLAPGERIDILYGAGRLGARVDRYAERGARLWLAVDGDGDGVRRLLEDSPKVEVRAREATRLVATLPTTAEPGDPLRLTLALVDAQGNAGIPYAGEIRIEADPALGLPESLALDPADRGHGTVTGRAGHEGIFRLRASAMTPAGPLETESNPLVVRSAVGPVLWGDLHGHSQISDGTGTPADYYDYARNVAALDVAALTDHDHWGMRFLDAHPALWQEIRAATALFNEPGRFVTLLGYEWTSWLQGHRHVLYFGDRGEVLSSLDPKYQTPDQLWEALRGQPVLTFAHHSAGGPVSTNWTWAPPPDLEPVTEIASVHGSSEAADSPAPIYKPVPGNYVRDALRIGYRFGFIGSGDSHDGHPGLAGIATGGVSGLAAIRAGERTRESVLAALRARRTYATNGPRIYLDASLSEPAKDGDAGELDVSGRTLRVEIAAVAPVERVDFIRTGLLASVPGEGRRDFEIERRIPALAPGEFLYVRVVQADGGTAWSSPFYGPRPAEQPQPEPPRPPPEGP